MDSIELLNFINTVKNNTTLYIKGYDAYAMKIDGYVGVMIINENKIDIYERFNRAQLVNLVIKTHDIDEDYICLRIKEDYLNEFFATLCLSFIDKNNRKYIQKDPFNWAEQWQIILGNTKKDRLVYDVLGEMYMLLYSMESKENPKWNSITRGSFDITSDNAVYEVKTTTERIGSFITIHNQFQLRAKELSKDLYIAFIRVEKNNGGTNIDELFNKLVKLGYNKEELEKYLVEIGYGISSKGRYEKYVVHSVDLYKVDNTFPKIDDSSFVGGKMPSRVVKLEYTISLDGLSSIKIL